MKVLMSLIVTTLCNSTRALIAMPKWYLKHYGANRVLRNFNSLPNHQYFLSEKIFLYHHQKLIKESTWKESVYEQE